MRTPSMQFAPIVLRHPAGWIASGFGAGFSPLASGTVGTLAALLPWFALRELSLPGYALMLLATFAIGVWSAGWVIRRIEVQDPAVVVWDEFLGLWITLMAVPQGWHWIALGFGLFRLFDIWKPWPVSWADAKLHGGFGAMLDDAFAGIYALLALQVIAWMAGATLPWMQ